MVAGSTFLRAKVRKRWQAASLLQCGGEPSRGAEQDAQRTLLYLPEINDGQEATRRKTLQVFDESTAKQQTHDAEFVP
jgi:hypothetical protein